MSQIIEEMTFHDLEPEKEVFLNDVTSGLSRIQKTLPCKYFYDETGSRLFNEICQTEEYYPTRTELKIMRTYAQEMVALLKPGCLLIEYGSGNGEKIRLLLNHLNDPAGYIPIDISKEHLRQAAEDLNRDYPHLEVLALCADFTQKFHIPTPQRKVQQRVVYFPGSTIGNFSQEAALDLLVNMKSFLNPGDGLLIGIDLKKDERILNKAYNDQAGYTEAFNRNVLSRINNELSGDFDLDAFAHHAFYNDEQGRVEMHLVSRQDQCVRIQDHPFHFREGESIHTESSHKYHIDEFAQLAQKADLYLKESWQDEAKLFGVLFFVREDV